MISLHYAVAAPALPTPDDAVVWVLEALAAPGVIVLLFVIVNAALRFRQS